ncbi:MAG: 6-phosphofructokinase, partial [Thermoplasmata archaeon M11B2D]
MKKIGILTGGGDCRGHNAVIRAVVKKSLKNTWEVIGIIDGWKGLIEGTVMQLTDQDVSGILPKGGTILGTSRTSPFKEPKNVDKLLANVKKFKLDALIAIGGEDTLGVALNLHKIGVPVGGVPKTIDNDISGTD